MPNSINATTLLQWIKKFREMKKRAPAFTALGAPKRHYKIRRYGPTDRGTNGRTEDRMAYGRTDAPDGLSHRGASWHLFTHFTQFFIGPTKFHFPFQLSLSLTGVPYQQ